MDRIYQGITDPNFGYFYIIPDHPVKTDHLIVRLFGKTEFQDTYQLVEITGKLDREAANDMSVQKYQSLNIAEIEVFESP